MGLPCATAFRFGQGHFEAVFNSILMAGETKNARTKSTRWSMWQSWFWGCDMTLGTHPAASKVRQKHETTKGRKDDKHPRAELGRTAFGSPNSKYLSNPKMAGRIRRLKRTVPFTFRRLEGGASRGASSPSQGGFKGA